MEKSITITCIAIALVAIMTSSVSGTLCRDSYFDCAKYQLFCQTPILREKCKLTCGVCRPGECANNNGGCAHICQFSQSGGTSCSCFFGYRLTADNRTCVDIDECTNGPNPCPSGQHCVNNAGSYSCEDNNCSHTPGKMNYYRSGQCCTIRNGTCGVTASIRGALRDDVEPVIRVFGGEEASYSAWPWQAQLTYQGFHHCGASLIANEWLVGAAHCFHEHSFGEMLVHLGSIRGAHINHGDHTTRQTRAIARVITHPAATGYVDDIALIQLASPVTFNGAVQPICLPCGEDVLPGKKCWVTGYGRTEESGGDSAATLREVDVPVVEHQECAEAYQRRHEIHQDKMMCAGYQEGRKDTCIGDSGGPMACQSENSCQWFLAGVTSFGRGCGVPGYYGVYTKVKNYEGWIRETIGNNATGLCESSPCQGLKDLDGDCETKLDNCSAFPHYMRTNCRRTCCRLQNNEISNCRDNPGSEDMCASIKQQCTLPLLRHLMETHCRKTCGLCS